MRIPCCPIWSCQQSTANATAATIGIEQKIKFAGQLTEFLRENGLVIDDFSEVIEGATIADVDQPGSGVSQWIDRAKEAGRKAGKMVAEEGAKTLIRHIMSGQFDPSQLMSFFINSSVRSRVSINDK